MCISEERDDWTRLCIFHPATATTPLGYQADLASGSVQPATFPLRTIDKANAWHHAGESRNKRILAGTHWVPSKTMHEFLGGFRMRSISLGVQPREKSLSQRARKPVPKLLEAQD